MFDPSKKRIVPQRMIWDSIKRGEIMHLTIDLETSGFVKGGPDYATPNSPFITEYGDCLTDFAGNYLNSAQVFPRRPEWLLAQPGAAVLQRLENGPEDYDDPEKMAYWNAMASMAWRIEQAAYAYDDPLFDHKTENIRFTDYNSQRKGGSVESSDQAIPIPMLNDDGDTIYPARYHPLSKRVSYRFQKHTPGFDYEGTSNLYYQDKDDGTLWKWVNAGIGISGFNFNNYDLGIFISNLLRVGFDPADSAFLYARAMVNSKQNKKNHIFEVRDLAMATHLYGPQGERGLQLGELIDPATGRARSTEALAKYLEANKGQANPLRMVMGGAFMPKDGEYHDDAFDHGAHYDAAGTAALKNLCADIDPETYRILNAQSDEKTTHQVLLTNALRDQKLPIVSLTRRDGGNSYSELPYFYLGPDDQQGSFKRDIYLKVDGTLHTLGLDKMNVEEMELFLDSKEQQGPDKAIRIMPIRKDTGHFTLDHVLQNTSLAGKYRQRAGDIEKDCNYILENPKMTETILLAQGRKQARMRFNSGIPQNPLMEDEFPSQFGAEIHFLDDPDSIKTRKGAEAVHPVIKKIKAEMDNDYGRYMREIDRSIRQLSIKAHMIDNFKGYSESDVLTRYTNAIRQTTQLGEFNHIDLENPDHNGHPDHAEAQKQFNKFVKVLEGAYADLQDEMKNNKTQGEVIFDQVKNPKTGQPFFQKGKLQVSSIQEALYFKMALNSRVKEAAAYLNDFTTLVNKTYKTKFDKKGWPYKDVLSRFKNPRTKKTFYQKKAFAFSTPAEAFQLRRQIGLHLLQGYLKELRKEDSPYSTGLVDKKYGHNNPKQMIIADPDNGEKGATPYISDKSGREISPATLKQYKTKDVLRNLSKGEWRAQYYRLSSEPSIMRLLHRFVDLDMKDDIPEELYKYVYFADLQNRLWGMENETEDTARIANLVTFEKELLRLELSSSMRNPSLLEKDSNPMMGEAAKAVQMEEGQRILAACREWLDTMKQRYPKRPELILTGGHDPDTGAALDYIKHNRLLHRDEGKKFTNDNNFVVIDLPARHLRNPFKQTDTELPHTSLVIRNLSDTKKKAIKSGRKVVLRELETGRLYTTGPATLHLFPEKEKSNFTVLRNKARQDYENSGAPLNGRDKPVILGIENIYPLANTRNVAHNVQSFKLPFLQFDALTAPQLSSLGDTPLTSVIVPIGYCPQHLEPGKLIRLREMSADIFSNIDGKAELETGHIYDSILRSVIGLDNETGKKVGITLRELTDQIRSGDISPKLVESMGFMSADHMDARLNEWAVGGWKDDPMEQEVLVASFDPVNAEYFKNKRDESLNTWAFFNALAAPESAMIRNGEPLKPSAYQDYGWAEPETT